VPLVFTLGICCEASKAKVNNLNHLGLLFNKYIIELDVSMRNSNRMQILKTLRYLLEKPTAHLLFYNSIGTLCFHVLMHTNTVDEIGHYANLLGCLNQVIHPDAVGVV
jgi:hypothetical protein